ncbi:2-C-methyl-D-erythritol 2,4-cyclodiphosphate synthase [Spiribacter roseus]|uniref:2-C-methyl-D-erythritol 2,4-cyclodiphosphate synthase n=1 Tax=Spiribacter roseus TaxID=1855875 RepID=UPI002E136AC3|nr:2-C-methyl-D-erythritol 2,4-cyclodiphosphate synthase [Spiribacter roseus]KAF0283446.1 2-C-methyl-D-erythritol 2,4-cyclodiphosphate synthase [Spiribacter roseus]
MRIGQGIDAHRLVVDRRLVLGGVEVAYEYGLAAHSDGDVLLHALCDALLGAVGQSDIGQHFPDTDAAYAQIDSRVLLRRVGALVAGQGGVIGNLDATLIAQRPRLAPHLPAMRTRIAADLDLSEGQINLKATTLEWMGFTGRGEGIAASAVALVDCP